MEVKASYMITYREGDGPERGDNLRAVLGWLCGFPGVEVIVVEQDTVPRFTPEETPALFRHLFAYNPGPFNKSWGFNVAFRHASSAILAFGDGDVIVPGEQMAQALDACARAYAAVNPYRRIVDLTPEESSVVRQGAFDFSPARAPQSAPNREGIGEKVVFCGGVFAVRRDAFVHLGGWDERFRGWGGEDDALSYLVQRARVPAIELDVRTALHLWHPRTHEQTFGQPDYAANRQRLAEYRDYSDEQLRRLAEILMQCSGNREKYRPFRP